MHSRRVTVAALAVAVLVLPTFLATAPAIPVPATPLFDGHRNPADWPGYGHDLWNSRHNPAEPDLRDAGVPTVLWTADLGGDVAGTPAVVGDTVYAAAYNGRIAALDARTGAKRWSHENGDPITSSLAVSRGRVFFTDKGGHAGALDARTGGLLWKRDLSFGQDNVALYGSPVPAGGLVVLGRSSGQEFMDGRLDFRGSVTALDPATGRIAWNAYLAAPGEEGVAVWTTPAVDLAGRTVFVGTGNAYTEPAGRYSDSIVALDLDTGRVKWSKQWWDDDVWTAQNQDGPDYDFGASPNLFPLYTGAGYHWRLAVGEGQKSGDYHVHDAATGKHAWSKRIGPGALLGGFLGSTATWNGRIYAGMVSAGSPADGRVPGDAETLVNTLPTGGKFVIFNDRDGTIEHQTPTVPTISAAAIAGGVVYQGDVSGTLWARDATTGDLLWAYPTGEAMNSGPSVSRGALYVGTGFGEGAPGTGHHVWALALRG